MRESPVIPAPSRWRPGTPVAVVGVLAALLIAGACASFGGELPPPSPEEIPALEARLATDSADAATARRLGNAYRAAGRHEDALAVLELARVQDPADPTPVLLLGLTYEDMERFGAARSAYEEYLSASESDSMNERVRQRLRLLERKQLLAEVQQTLAREEQLANAEPEPGTVAVFPFRLADGDPEMEPLTRALADLLSTDLSHTDRLRVLERSRVQLLVDEMGLTEQGLVDPGSAVRSGRMLGAARVVQGSLGAADDQWALQAVVVPVAGAEEIPLSMESRGAAEAFFDLEKQLALQIYEQMGIQLTPAEEQLVTRRPTENMAAIVEYGRGLIAADRGEYLQAAEAFNRAAALDPGFAPAQTRAEEASAAAAATATSTQEVASAASSETEVVPVDPAIDALVPTALGRDPTVEAFGHEGIAGGASILEIIFPGR